MIVVDTSIWIEFLKKQSPTFAKMKSLLENQQVLSIDCIFGELLQGAKNQREQNIILDY